MKIGIELVSMYVPHHYVNLKNLEEERNQTETNYQGLIQEKMSVCSPDEDIVTMGYSASKNIIEKIDYINKEVRKPPRPGDGSFNTDAGLLTHLPHPFNPEKHVLMIAGCWGQGTVGGVNLLINEVNEIWKKTKDNFFQVVYDVQLDSNQNPTTEKIDWETLEILHPKSTPPDWKISSSNFSDQFEKEVSVVIPCKNEENTVANVVRTFKDHKAVGEIIVIDNDSTDETSKNAEEAGAKVISEKKQGKGYALKAGMQYCQYPFHHSR